MSDNKDRSPLGYRLGVEAFSATVSSFLVAPMIAIVDQAVVSNASGLKQLVPAMIDGVKTLIIKPHVFLKQPAFLTCWGVYAGIFTVANSISAICERTDTEPFYYKFFLTSLISVNLNIAKDRYFAKLFGIGAPKPMAYSSMACFGARNGMTILAAFSMPPHVSKMVQSDLGVPKQRADQLTQLIIPITMQVFNTPLHLLGYDIYNREGANWSERTTFIRREYSKTLVARIGHIFPAYGVGGVLNEYIRAAGTQYVNDLHLGSGVGSGVGSGSGNNAGVSGAGSSASGGSASGGSGSGNVRGQRGGLVVLAEGAKSRDNAE